MSARVGRPDEMQNKPPPSVSVVVCSHNQLGRLKLALASWLAQSVSPLELIVVDDGSTDGTRAWLEPWITSIASTLSFAVRVLTTGTSALGAATARNVGASAARGDVVLFADGDVLVAPDHVDHHANAHRQADVVCVGPMRHTPHTSFLQDPREGVFVAGYQHTHAPVRVEGDSFAAWNAVAEDGTYPGLAWMREEFARPGPLLWMLGCPQNMSVSRAHFIGASGFDTTLPFSEGWDLSIRLEQRGVRHVALPHAVAIHLYHARSVGVDALCRRVRALSQMAHKLGLPGLYATMLYYAAMGGDPFVPARLGMRSRSTVAALLDRGGPDLEHVLATHPQIGVALGLVHGGQQQHPLTPAEERQPLALVEHRRDVS